MPLTLLVAQKQVVLSDKPLEDRNKKIVVDHVTFVVEEMTQLPTKQYQLRLSATDDGDGTLLNTLYQRIEIVDVKGNKMTANSSGWSGNGTNNVRLTMTYLRRRYGLPIDDLVAGGIYKRHCGDAGDRGRGEILEWAGR